MKHKTCLPSFLPFKNVVFTSKKRTFYSNLFTIFSLLLLSGCADSESIMTDNSLNPCANKPNCVSSIDPRPSHAILPFILIHSDINMTQILTQAKQLSGAKVVVEQADYAKIECTSPIMHFVDDLELRIQGEKLIVRSESRVGYYDFNANKKRTELLREKLLQANLIKAN